MAKKKEEPLVLNLKRNPLKNPASVRPIGAAGDGMVEQFYKASVTTNIPLASIDTAPAEWNFFTDASDDVLEKIAKSITQYGLLNPITVWEQGNGRYMILSGHSRFRAYKLLKELFNEKYPDQECPYDRITAKVFLHDQLTEEDARFVIILANTAQRALESKTDRIKAVCEMTQLMSSKPIRDRTEKGRIGKLIAKKLGLGESTVYLYRNLGGLIPELMDLTMNGKITLEKAQELGKLPADVQQYIAENCLYKRIPSSRAAASKFLGALRGKGVDEVKAIFDSLVEIKKMHTIRFEVPFTLPRGCAPVGVIIPKEQKDDLIKFLLNAVELYPDEQARKQLRECLQGQQDQKNPEN